MHTLLSLCLDRAVRGAVGDGDACGITNGHQPRGFVPGARVWPFCHSYCVHPPGHGGAVCIPSRPPVALVK